MKRYLQDWVTEWAASQPDAIAVALNEQTLRYRELDEWSTQLAHTLRHHGCREGDRICMLMPKSPRAIATLLGIYKAGCIYVPLDWESPAARTASIISSSEPGMLLAAGPVQTLLSDLFKDGGQNNTVPLGWLDPELEAPEAPQLCFSAGDVGNASMTPLTLEAPAETAHLLFTSGSTGVPKGVEVTHDSVITFVEWAVRYFGLDSSERVSGHSPLHFDLSILDIFGAFAAGAELHLVPEDLKLRPDRLAAWMREKRLTQWFSVPAVFTYMAKFNVLRQDDFPDLRRVMWCGEVLPVPSLIYWMQRIPHAQFTNLYGPTETTIASSYYTVGECPDGSVTEIPIGRGCDGEELLILNEQMQAVAAGETGDLYIKGAGLSPGYWRDPEKTSQVFITHPDTGERLYRTGDLARRGSDGEVYFVGRNDTQVKSRGFRIELGEIEAALNKIDALRESAVVALTSQGFDGATLCCSYVPNDEQLTAAQLRDELSKALPFYMIPSRWKMHAALPRNGSGKIDRRQLKENWQAEETAKKTEVSREQNIV